MMQGHTLPRIAVAPTKFIKGISRLTDSADAMRVMPLREALATEFGTDAHFCCYSVIEAGVEAPAWPRLNKVVLDAIEAANGRVYSTMLVIDYDTNDNLDAETYAKKKDTEGKVAWDDELIEEFWLKLDAAVEDNGLPMPNVVYTTKNGARFIYVLPEPILVREIEAYHRGLVHLFGKAGLTADQKCSDWTRFFRMPRVMRDGKASWSTPYFRLLEQWDTFVNLADVPKVEKPQGADTYAPLKSIDGPRPSIEEAKAMLEALSPSPGVSLVAETMRRLQGRNCYDCLFNGAPIASRGERDSTLLSYVGEAVALLHGVAGVTPEFIYALFVEAVEQLEPDAGTPDWLAKLWYVVSYTWVREEARAESHRVAEQASARPHREVPAFPDGVLPPDVELPIRDFGASLGDTDANLVGPAALSALSAAIQFHLDSAVSPFHVRPCPTGIETCTVAPSGLAKTTVLNELNKEHWDRDRLHKMNFELARRRHEVQLGAFRERQKQMQREFAKEKVNREHEPNEAQGLAALQLEADRMPAPPKSEEFILSNTTPEATVEFMAGTRNETAYVISGEGTTLQIATGGQYSDRVSTDEWCDIWSGSPVKFNRIRLNGLGLALREPRIAGAYALQPSKAAALAANFEARGNGYFARKLFTLCRSARLPRAAEKRRRATFDLSPFHRRVRSILWKPVQPERRAIRATPEAEAIFDGFHDEVQDKREPGGLYTGEHEPWGNRVLEHVCRLAVIVEVLWNGIDSPAVSVESIERAIRLVRYFDAHYWALFGASEGRMDPVAAFAAEYIVEDANGRLLQSGLYDQFRSYCSERGHSKLIESQVFWEQLKTCLGLQGQPSGKPRHFKGFRLARPSIEGVRR